MKNNIKERFEKICNEYFLEFCKKHDYRTEKDNYWVGDEVGRIAGINDMFVSFDDIRYDIDNDIPKETFEKWYWRSVEVEEILNHHYMNYKSFCKGCPEPEGFEEKLQNIKELKEQLNAMSEEINSEF